jgi:hypothetical protein
MEKDVKKDVKKERDDVTRQIAITYGPVEQAAYCVTLQVRMRRRVKNRDGRDAKTNR